MSTWFGKAFRAVASTIQAPVQGLTGKKIFNESYVGEISKLPTTKAAGWFGQLIGAKTGDDTKKDVTSLIGEGITNVFGGVAEKAGTADGQAAGATISKQAPSWLWPIIIVAAIIIVFGTLIITIVKKRKRRR